MKISHQTKTQSLTGRRSSACGNYWRTQSRAASAAPW